MPAFTVDERLAMLKEVARLGGDVSSFVSAPVLARLKKRYGKG